MSSFDRISEKIYNLYKFIFIMIIDKNLWKLLIREVKWVFIIVSSNVSISYPKEYCIILRSLSDVCEIKVFRPRATVLEFTPKISGDVSRNPKFGIFTIYRMNIKILKICPTTLGRLKWLLRCDVISIWDFSHNIRFQYRL